MHSTRRTRLWRVRGLMAALDRMIGVDSEVQSSPRLGQVAYDIPKGVVLFVGLGPPLGGLVVAFMMLIVQVVDAVPPGASPQWELGFGLFVVAPLFSYLVAAVPSAVAGVFAGLMRRVNWPHRVLVNATLSAVSAALLAGQVGLLKGNYEPAVAAFFLAVPSFLAAAVLSRWFFRRAAVQQVAQADGPASGGSAA